jgi:TPR repeat protein
MGMLHGQGRAGLARDYKKAFDYFLKAASQKPYVKTSAGAVMEDLSVAIAAGMVAEYYRDEILGPQADKTVALQWFLRSASHWCPPAMYNVAKAFQRGVGCPKNVEAALFWYRLAAERGQFQALVEYAKMLMSGLGDPRDGVEVATELLKDAAEKGVPGAPSLVKSLTSWASRGGAAAVAERKSTVEKAEAAFSAAKSLFKLVVSSAGDLSRGRVSRREVLAKVEVKLREAASLGHRRAELALGKLLRRLRMAEQAFPFIRSAAECGVDEEAQLLLGMLLAFGDGCERDEKEARRWLLRWGSFDNFADVEDLMMLGTVACAIKKDKKDLAEGFEYREGALCLFHCLGAEEREVKRKSLGPYLKLTDVFDFSGSSVSPEGQAVASDGGWVDFCTNCGELELVKWCSGCNIVKYCGRECQKVHWKYHKKACAE